MKFRVKVRKWHKWLALIIGIQIFIWTASGLFMSFVPIETIRSEHLSAKPKRIFLKTETSFLSINEVISKFPQKRVSEVKLKSLLDFFVYELTFEDKTQSLVDALSGKVLNPISKELARKVALAHYKGDAEVKKVELIKDEIIEFRGKLPVWKIDFDNSESTSFYVSPDNGRLRARRGTLWRIYDFMWMLHIMDYKDRDNFNQWWLVLAAFLAVAVCVTGLILIRFSFHWAKRS